MSKVDCLIATPEQPPMFQTTPRHSRDALADLARGEEQFQVFAGAVDRNPEHLAPVTYPREAQARIAIEDEEL